MTSSAPPEILLTIMEGLANTLATEAVAVLFHPDNELQHWIGDRNIAEELGKRIDSRALVEEPYGTLETLAATDAMPGTAYVAAYPVMTPQGPEDYVVVVAGSDSRERNAGWALLQALACEATRELLVQINAPSIHAALEDTAIGVSIAAMHLADTPLVYVNAGFERLTGYTRAEAIGRNCRFLQDGLGNTPERRIIRDALATGQGCTVELENVRKDGRRFINLLKLRPVYTGATWPAYYIGFQSDITTQREAEQARDSIIDAAPVAMLVADPDGRIRRINRHLEAMFGYPEDELLGQAVETLIPQSLRARHGELRAAFQQAPTKRQMGPDRELRGRRKDGTDIPVEVGLNHYRDRGETRIIAAITDISDRKALENSLREKKDAAERAYRAQADFFANVSHELKTPLNAIIGFSDIFKIKPSGSEIGPKELDYAKDINDSAHHLLDLIEHILQSAKLAAGEWAIDPFRLNIAELVRYAARQIEGHAGAKNLELRVDVQAELPWLWADERSLRQVLINLLSNATKYTSAGGRIEVGARVSENNEICIAVTDTGRGMDKDEKRRALEPFGQVAAIYTRREGGTGLGLSIVQSLVELHQGRLEIDTVKGRGTTVRVIMPAERTCAEA